MLGNVAEWCQDVYEYYPVESRTDYVNLSSGGNKVFRGGDYDSKAQDIRCASRYSGKPDVGERLKREGGFVRVGMRIVLEESQ